MSEELTPQARALLAASDPSLDLPPDVHDRVRKRLAATLAGDGAVAPPAKLGSVSPKDGLVGEAPAAHAAANPTIARLTPPVFACTRTDVDPFRPTRGPKAKIPQGPATDQPSASASTIDWASVAPFSAPREPGFQVIPSPPSLVRGMMWKCTWKTAWCAAAPLFCSTL